MIYGITGPSTLTSEQYSHVYSFVQHNLHEGDVLVSGCADGADTAAAYAALEAGARVHLVVPAAPHNERLVVQLMGMSRVKIEHMPEMSPDRTPAERYMVRNDRVVELIRTGELLAALKSLTFYRSGEWATVNRAERAGVYVRKELI